jgi:hypothetical protein
MPQCHRGKFPEQYYNLWWDLEGRAILEIIFGPDLLWESEDLYLARWIRRSRRRKIT